MADINFTCLNCKTLLTADDSLVGQEIACPTCNEALIVQDQSGMEGTGSGSGLRLSVASGSGDPGQIQKPAKPLEIAAKAAIKVRCKTIRHHDHVKDGKDNFDAAVSRFLDETGEPNIVSVESIQYTWFDSETKVPMTDYGAMIIYKGL